MLGLSRPWIATARSKVSYIDYVWRGTYSVKAPERVTHDGIDYVFDHWEVSDGVNVGERRSSATSISISDDGELIAYYLLIISGLKV